MKKILLIIAGIFIYFFSISQDLVVTDNNDSINCKIEKIEGYNIYFSYVKKNTIKNEYILLKNIKDYEFNYFDYSRINEFKKNVYNKSPHLGIAVNVGYAYQIGTINPFFTHDTVKYKESRDELRHGLLLGANLSYFFPKVFGLGIKSSFFISTSNYVYDESRTDYKDYKFSQFVSYVGPSVYFRILMPNKKSAFIIDASAGYMHYSVNERPKDNSLVANNKITGNTLGYSFGLEYNLKITNYFSLGINASYLLGHLNSYNIKTGTSSSEKYNLNKEPYGNLNRIDFSLGLRFIII